MVKRNRVKKPSVKVKNPCINVCEYIPDTDICNGCGRTADEIVEWYTADGVRKLEIVELAKERLDKHAKD